MVSASVVACLLSPRCVLEGSRSPPEGHLLKNLTPLLYCLQRKKKRNEPDPEVVALLKVGCTLGRCASTYCTQVSAVMHALHAQVSRISWT